MTVVPPGKRLVFSIICGLGFLAGRGLGADQIEMQNGDRYNVKVIEFTNDFLVVQSDLLGTLRLPRSKVASITLGSGSATGPNLARVAGQTNRPYVATGSGSTNDIAAALRQLGPQTNLIQQVRGQFLSGAGPEANQKFDELMGGLLSGKLNVEDIRKEAAAAANQLRALQKEGGTEAGFAVDGYLAILDNFLRETAPAKGSVTNTTIHPAKSKPAAEKEEE